jgi:multiple sugar transport system permease protein
MSKRRTFLIAWLFLLPNLLGFLVFTAGPVAFSLYMSFTDWALTRHNEYSAAEVSMIGFENYRRLLVGDEAPLFWEYFGNTVYLMLGIPIGIAGSLVLALLLHQNIGPKRSSTKTGACIVAVLITVLATGATWVLTTPGAAPTPDMANYATMTADSGLGNLTVWELQQLRSGAATLAMALLGVLVATGIAIGPVFFRTVFYLPSLLAGVAIFLLWKALYKPQGGLINSALEPALDSMQALVTTTPGWLWYGSGIVLWAVGGLLCLYWLIKALRGVALGDISSLSFVGFALAIASVAATVLGLGYVLCQLPVRSLFPSGMEMLTAADLEALGQALIAQFPSADAEDIRVTVLTLGESIRPTTAIETFTGVVGDGASVREAVMGLTEPIHNGLTSGDGLRPPEWLIDIRWAKPALIIMGVWTAVGGGNMLLYLAGLANVPPELYEAADIDGASGWQRFAHVTWPQLAPTTFFIVIMSTIGGLQGGFDQARVMTEGKAGTTVLSYYLYNIAFDDQFQLGLASAIAWVMFAMIFAMTVLNYRFGSRTTNL